LGTVARQLLHGHTYRRLEFVRLSDYAREHLGIPVRKAWALLEVERSTWRADDFARAYDAPRSCTSVRTRRGNAR
jgi:hypothetical protein